MIFCNFKRFHTVTDKPLKNQRINKLLIHQAYKPQPFLGGIVNHFQRLNNSSLGYYLIVTKTSKLLLSTTGSIFFVYLVVFRSI